jgi:DNA-binding IclR family transcriptional regulator
LPFCHSFSATALSQGPPRDMTTIDQLEAALRAARAAGYQVRHEWLGGQGCAACELHGRRVLFVDLAVDPAEQLEQVAAALELGAPSPGRNAASRRAA